MRRKTTFGMRHAQKPRFRNYGKGLVTAVPDDPYPAPRWKVVLVVALCLSAILIMLLCSGCATQPSEPYVTVTDQWVEYNPVPKNGIYGKTKGGAILVTPERFLWAEDLAIENEELKLKLEQERLSKLKNP